MLNHLNILPRRIIFVLDLLICCLSLTGSYLVAYNFNFAALGHIEFTHCMVVSLFLNAIIFFVVRTYAGIIQYTSAQDSFRILFAIAVSNAVFYLINIFSFSFGGRTLIAGSSLLLNSLASFMLMISYRMLAKYVFLYIKNINLERKRVVIYGAGEAGVAAKRTFDHNHTINKQVIAFTDDNPKKAGNTLLGIKIIDTYQLDELIQKNKLDELIFATSNLPLERKNNIIDVCLEHNIKVLNIPPHDQWSDDKLKPIQIQNINIEDLLNRDSIQIDTTGIQNELQGKRILITGAAGSIGSEIVRQLLKFDTGLIIMCDQAETALHHLYMEIQDMNLDKNFHAFIGDVKDGERMQHLFENFKPQYVYHAAAYKHVPLMEDNASEAIKTNVMGTKIIADLSVKHNVQKFVMISTDKAVNPTNVMGASKRIAEIYVQSLNESINLDDYYQKTGLKISGPNRPKTRFITTRFGNVLGSNGSVIPRFKEQIQRGGPITVTHPEITRYFMTIPEACRLVLEAGCMGNGGEIYVFDMGKSVKIIDLAKRMIQLAGLVPNKDIKIEYTGLRPGEKLYEELLNDSENTLPTHHDKIMIGKVREYYFSDIETQVYDLVQHARRNDNVQVVTAMKKIVQEFKSNNSIFEELDMMVKSLQ